MKITTEHLRNFEEDGREDNELMKTAKKYENCLYSVGLYIIYTLYIHQ